MESSRAEWAKNWPLPFVSMIGITGAPAMAYSAGVLMEPLTKELGWTRTQFFSGITLQMMMALLVVPLIGLLIDRVGSRKVAIFGGFSYFLCFSALGLVQQPIWQWWALNVFMLAGGAFITQPVWVRPVVHAFARTRGLAVAIALSGNGVATSIWPFLAAICVGTLGWRLTFPTLSGGWLLVTLPLVILFFRDSDAQSPQLSDTTSEAAPKPERSIASIIGSGELIALTVAGAMFSLTAFGLTVHFVPLLRANGTALDVAASIAGLIGICAIVGRLGTGILLDRFPAAIIGCSVFALPIVTCILLFTSGDSIPAAMAAAAIMGLAQGAEIDVITYVASRRFDKAMFGSVFAVIIAAFGAMGSVGPLAAGYLFDLYGTYSYFLGLAASLCLVSAIMITIVAKDVRPLAAS